MPKFSVVIPTRQRGVNLRQSVPTVLAQTDGDFELIIQDNCSTDSTEEIVRSFNDDRIRYHRSDTPLSMQDNYEQALDLIRGDYAILLGDDDALMPDCLEKCRIILANNKTHLIRYNCHIYQWPDHQSPLRRNRLELALARGLRRESSRDFLKKIYDWRVSFWMAPGIYNGLVSRELIDTIRASAGRYFIDQQPDLGSYLVNLGFSESFIRCDAALGMAGSSGLSYGGSFLNFKARAEAQYRFYDEANRSTEKVEAGSMPGDSLTALMYGTLQRTKKKIFHDDHEIRINKHNALSQMIANIHEGSLPYDDYVADIRKYAKSLGRSPDRLSIPDRAEPTNPVGIRFNQFAHFAEILRLDGDALGITGLSHAVRVAFALTGPADLGGAVASAVDQSPSGVVAGLRKRLVLVCMLLMLALFYWRMGGLMHLF